MDEFEKDVEEWRRISSSNLESLADERFARLVAQKHEARLAAQEAAKAISSNLKSLETRQAEVGNAITPPTVLSLMLKTRLGRLRK